MENHTWGNLWGTTPVGHHCGTAPGIYTRWTTLADPLGGRHLGDTLRGPHMGDETWGTPVWGNTLRDRFDGTTHSGTTLRDPPWGSPIGAPNWGPSWGPHMGNPLGGTPLWEPHGGPPPCGPPIVGPQFGDYTWGTWGIILADTPTGTSLRGSPLGPPPGDPFLGTLLEGPHL